MTSVARYLLRPYAPQMAPDRRRPGLAEPGQTPTPRDSGRVIEAEWHPVSEPAAANKAYQTNSPLFLTEEAIPKKSESPQQVTTRYNDMTPQPQQPRGTLINIQA